MSIVVVRHGETEGNASRVLQLPDVPLNARGIRQAERLAERLHDFGITQIVCSDLLRARMTAQPIAKRLGIAVETTPLLQERNFGDLRGTPYANLSDNPFAPDFVPPNGESWPMFHQRVAQAFEHVAALRAKLARGHLLVVTHGLVCRAILVRHVARSEATPPPERFHNTSVTVLDPIAPYAARLTNCYVHLGPDDLELAGGAA
jgi:2,3-bisphosphoglycerate-dependent phosphoglycerate mutase